MDLLRMPPPFLLDSDGHVLDLVSENSILMDVVQDDLNFNRGIVQENLALMANKPGRLVVQFLDLYRERDVFCLEFGMRDPCNVVVGRVAEKLGVESLRIRLTRHCCFFHRPLPHHEEFKSTDVLSDILERPFQGCNVLYYEVLLPASELQHWLTLKVSYDYQHDKEIKVVLPKHSKVEDLLNDLKKKLITSNAELRLVGVYNCTIHTVFPLDEKIVDIPEYLKLQLEVLPEENLGPGHHVIRVNNYTMVDGVKIAKFGKPFLLVIHKDETVAEVRVRIKEKVSVYGPRLSQWKFTIIRVGGPKYLMDADVLSQCFEGKDKVWPQYIGLEHYHTPCDDSTREIMI